MIYNFRNPAFVDKVFAYKREEIRDNIEKTIKLIIEKIKLIPGIVDVELDESSTSKRRVKTIKSTLEKSLKINIKYNNQSNTKVLNYNLEIVYPVPEKHTLEFVINGVYRHPLFQLLDTFVVSKDIFRMIGTILTIHFNANKGWTGIADKKTHMGNMMCYYNDLEWFLEKCNHRLISISKSVTEKISERIVIEKIDPENESFDMLIENFLDQKINNKVKFNSKEFWWEMSNSFKYKKFNLIEYFDYVKQSDVFISLKLTQPSIPQELFHRFLNRDEHTQERGNLVRKDVLLSQYILGPLFSEILSFLISRSSYKVDKNKTVNITNYLSGKMPEMHHLADHGVTIIHSIGESMKGTYSGPQGLSKKSMPTDLRNIHESYYMNLDPILTADRQACGIVNFLTINSKLIEEKRNILFTEDEEGLID